MTQPMRLAGAMPERRGHRPAAWKTLALGLGIVVLMGLLAGGAAAFGAATKPVLRIGIQAATNPDPAKDTSAGVSWLMRDITYAPLIRYKIDGSLAPDLAVSWRYVKSSRGANKDFELTLRRGVRFSTGEPLTARAVVSWLKYFDTVSKSLTAAFGPGWTVKAVGGLKVQILTTIPNPSIAEVLSSGGIARNAGWVASPRAVANPNLFATGSYGAGQYVLKESVSGDHYTFAPNPRYYNPSAIKYSQIRVKVIGQPSSMLQAIKSGQLDASIGDASTGDAAKAAGLKVVAAPGYTLFMFLRDLNGSSVKALGDVRVRQAMNYAIDRKTIVKAAYGSYASPTAQIVEPPYSTPKSINAYQYDPAKAKSLLAAAGYKDGFSVKTMAVFFPTPVLYGAAKYLDDVGVHLNIVQPPTINDWLAAASSKDYPILTTGISSITDDWFYSVGPTASVNVFGHKDETLYRMWYRALKSPNALPIFRQFVDRIVTQAYYVPLAAVDNITFVTKHVGGVTTSAGVLGSTYPTMWFPT